MCCSFRGLLFSGFWLIDSIEGKGTVEPFEPVAKKDEVGGLPAGVVEKPIKEDGGGPAGVVEGCEASLDPRGGSGVEGGLEDPGTRKVIVEDVVTSSSGLWFHLY